MTKLTPSPSAQPATDRATQCDNPIELTAFDRCDRCGARAYLRVTFMGGELLFCGHHGRAHAPAFQTIATSIHDETAKLLVVR